MDDQMKASVLLSLTNIAANGPWRKQGICAHVEDDVAGFRFELLVPYFEKWPERNGLWYPVEGDFNGYAQGNDSRWDVTTEHGAKRYRLLAFLIHELTKELHL